MFFMQHSLAWIKELAELISLFDTFAYFYVFLLGIQRNQQQRHGED